MSNYLVDIINKRFSHLASKNVVIYGMGQLASVLLDNREYLIFNIVGVMDKNTVEGSFKGVPVLNVDNICSVAQVIIIAALGSNCPEIYSRIEFLTENGVDIYFPDGEKQSMNAVMHASKYFIETRKQLIKLINENDIISFDIFDTLVMRRCLFPFGVFRILEDCHSMNGFVEQRKYAEKSTSVQLGRLPTIYDIYERIPPCNVKPEDEIELEKEMLAMRGDMIYFFNYALEQKKTVILTSDMYLPETIMDDLLKGGGISGHERIFVSCDLNETKRSGKIWEKVRSIYPKGTILHIGDNITADYVSQHKITSYLIKGTIELAYLLGFGNAISYAQSSNDFLTIGTVLSKLLTFDLTNTDEDGRIIIENVEDIGYCFIAPQVLGFVMWLAKITSSNAEKQLCFCARDTYVFMHFYEKIRQRFDAPPATYLYISKRVLCGIIAGTLPDIRICLDCYYARFDSKTSIKEAVYRLFGVILPVNSFTSLSVKEVTSESLFRMIERFYFPLFQENAVIEKMNFLKYLKTSGIDNSKTALVDFFCGHSIRLLRKLFDGNYYFFGLTIPDINIDSANIYSWLEKTESLHVPYYNSAKYIQFGESVFSSSEGTCIKFNEYGVPVLDIEQRFFVLNQAILRGIETFISDIDYPVSCETSDKIYGALFSGSFSVKNLSDITWSSYTANK